MAAGPVGRNRQIPVMGDSLPLEMLTCERAAPRVGIPGPNKIEIRDELIREFVQLHRVEDKPSRCAHDAACRSTASSFSTPGRSTAEASPREIVRLRTHAALGIAAQPVGTSLTRHVAVDQLWRRGEAHPGVPNACRRRDVSAARDSTQGCRVRVLCERGRLSGQQECQFIVAGCLERRREAQLRGK